MNTGQTEDQDKSQVWITKLISFEFLILNEETCFQSHGRCENNPGLHGQEQHPALLFGCFLSND